MENIPRTLEFLDPDYYAGPNNPSATKGVSELESEFICVVCCGVVLDAVECKECSSLYCKRCLKSTSNFPCPKRCGSQEYTKVNRLIMNTLNKLPFRCQFGPKCDKIICYESYLAHYTECPEGKPKECENADCQLRVRNLMMEVTQLKEQLHEIELHKDRNNQIMRNQINDLK
jgi:hypothetical protein